MGRQRAGQWWPDLRGGAVIECERGDYWRLEHSVRLPGLLLECEWRKRVNADVGSGDGDTDEYRVA